MAKIELGIYANLLRRFLQLRGESYVGDELAPEISPVFVLEDVLPEWEFLKGHRLMANSVQVPPNIGQPGSVRWRNPPNSGCLAVFSAVKGSTITNVNTWVMTFGAQTADLPNVTNSLPRDGRQIPPSAGVIIVSWSNGAGPGGSALDSEVTATNFAFRATAMPVIVPPGFALNVTTSLTNLQVEYSATWIEKRLDDLEAR